MSSQREQVLDVIKEYKEANIDRNYGPSLSGTITAVFEIIMILLEKGIIKGKDDS